MAFKEFYRISKKRRKSLKKIKNQLYKKKEIIFAYLYGSFLEDTSFRDIDIGIYLDEKIVKGKQFFRYQLKMVKELEISPKYIIDIRIINNSSLSFLSSIFKIGKILSSKDDKLLTGLIEKASFESSISEPFLRHSFLELIS